MAKLTEREVVILVKALGLDKAIAGFGTLDKSIKKTQKTSGELDRNMKGTANITSNTTKAFAKQAQGLGGLVHVYATVAANVFALSSAFNVLKQNADLKIMEQASKQLSVSSGTNFGLVAKSLKEVTGGAISFKEAMQTTTLGLRGGATSTQLQQITDVATKAAKALGRSVPEAVTRLTQAVIKGEPELADEFGIILRVEEAVKKYAAAHNKAATSLTTFERQQAIINQAIEQGNKKYGELKLDTNPYDKLAATFSELTQKILQFVSIPIGGIFKILADNTTLMTIAILAFAKAVAQKALPEVFKLGAAMIDNAKRASSEAIISYNAQAEALDNLGKKQERWAAINRTKKINLIGTLSTTGLKDALPKLSKELDAAKGDLGKMSQTLFRTFYSQIHREAKKFGGDISKVVATNIRNPLQREFLLINQEMLKMKTSGNFNLKAVLNQTVAGVKLTVQELGYLNSALKVYQQELAKGVSSSEALKAAQNRLATSTAGVRAAFGKLFIEGRQLYGSFATLKLGMTQGSQLMQQGALQGKNLKESVALVKKELEGAGVSLDRVNPKILSFGVGIGKGIGMMSNFISAVGSIVGGLFNLVMVVTLVWQGLQVLAGWLGITNTKVDELTSSFDEMQDSIDTTTEIIQEYKKYINEASEATELLGSKIESLGKKAAIFDTLATQAKAFAKKMREIAQEGGEGWQIFGRSDAVKQATTQFKTQLAQYKEMTGNLPQLFSTDVQNLITPEDLFKKLNSKTLSLYLQGELETAFKDAYSKAIEKGIQVFDQAGELTKEFKAVFKVTVNSDEAYKSLQNIRNGVDGLIADLNQATTAAFFDKLGQLDQGTLLQNFISKLEGVKKLTPEIAAELALWYEVMERNSAAAANFANVQKSSLEDIGSTLNQVNSDIENSLKNLNTDTTGGMEKSIEKVIGVALKLKGVFESYPDPKDLDPFSIMMEKAPRVIEYLNLTKENFSTQEKAVATLGTIIENNLAKYREQAQLTVDIAIAENNLAIAKRQTAAVESKNFAEKKAAYENQFQAEENLIQLQIKQIELRIVELQKVRDVTAGLYDQAKAQNDVAQQLLATIALSNVDQSLITAKGQLDELKASLAALPGLKKQALGKVDSAASKAGESAADKAQKQAEKMANLEASIAKKRLERATMFLALEKELGDAVESRMNWELTGAREAVALGNKRIAILGRELSMQASLVPMKKAVMEAEAHALEVKAQGLEKEGELKAAEEARLEVMNKRQEMNNLDIEYITMRLEYEQKLYDIGLKQHELRKRAMIPTFKEGSGIQGSEEFFQTAKVEFALRWDKFLDEMTTPVDRLLDAFEGAVDSGVDAFVEAIANGEDALTAAKEAIKQTMFELAKEWLKEDLKNIIYSTVGSALGMEDPKDALKEELAKMAQQDQAYQTTMSQHTQMHTDQFTQMIQGINRIGMQGGQQGGGFGNQLSGMFDSMFGMNQQQFGSVSAGLEDLFNNQPDIFGSNAGLSGQLDNLFASQPDIFGSTPGYVDAFSGGSSSFGLGGLGSAFSSVFGTMPTAPTESIVSGDIFGGSNPLAMSNGSLMNIAGMGSMYAPGTSSMTGMAGMQSAMPMQSGIMGAPPTSSFGGMGGMMGGMGASSMLMGMIPMLMGGLGGGSPAGQAAKEKTGTKSGDSALGGKDEGSDNLEDLKEETEELKDLSEKLLTEIRDNILEIKINQIDFQIEHMEKMDKQFQMWLAIYMVTHMQNLMLFTMMYTSLQMIQMYTQASWIELMKISNCTCQGGGGFGMAKGGIVSGLVRGYAKGAITTGPELAMIGEGRQREAIVPLPDNRAIPVEFTNNEDSKDTTTDNSPINITINGVEGTEKGLKRSAAQIAYQVDRARRNTLSRY